MIGVPKPTPMDRFGLRIGQITFGVLRLIGVTGEDIRTRVPRNVCSYIIQFAALRRTLDGDVYRINSFERAAKVRAFANEVRSGNDGLAGSKGPCEIVKYITRFLLILIIFDKKSENLYHSSKTSHYFKIKLKISENTIQ